ncbi:hypothetical protein K502DRAFT_368200 [Neoconidiobolus thromboides FSU 785]|nr:hypothetical protein K502DRAFT_368200 [Neoconidiobolus thromboides FSU 785]
MPPLNTSTQLLTIIKNKIQNGEQEDSVIPSMKSIEKEQIENIINGLKNELKGVKEKKDELIKKKSNKLKDINEFGDKVLNKSIELPEKLKAIEEEIVNKEDNLNIQFGVLMEKYNKAQDNYKIQIKFINSLQYFKEVNKIKVNLLTQINDKDYLNSIYTFKNLNELINNDKVENNSLIIQKLKDHLLLIKTQLIGYIDEEFNKEISINEKEMIINRNFINENNKIVNQEEKIISRMEDLLLCNELLNQNEQINKIINFINKQITAIIKESITINYKENDNEIHIQLTKDKNQMELSNKLNNILLFLKYMNTIYQINKINVIQQQLKTEFIYDLVITLVNKELPLSKNGIEHYKNKNYQQVKEFDNKIQQYINVENNNNNTTLTNYFNKLNDIYLINKRKELISLIRAILLEEKFNVLEINEEIKENENSINISINNLIVNFGLPLTLNKLNVPDTIVRIIINFEAYLKELEDYESSVIIIQSIRDSINLYIILLPLRQKIHFDERILLFNEMIYFIKELMRLQFIYSNKGEDKQIDIELMDFIKIILKKADELIIEEVDEFTLQMKDMLNNNNNKGIVFEKLEDSKQIKKIENKIQLIIQFINNFIQHFHLLNNKMIHYLLLNKIIIIINDYLINQILILNDIGAKESDLIKDLIEPYYLILKQRSFDQQFNSIKLDYLIHFILINSLKDIKLKLNDLLIYFNKEDLIHLILALFNPSNNRDQLITLIENK